MSSESIACPTGDKKVSLFGLLVETNARLAKELASALEAHASLPLAWFEALLQLRFSDDGRLRMSQMANAIVHSTGGTTRLIDRLEEAGYTRREHCPSDRRSIFVAITDQGNAKLDDALKVHLAFLDETIGTRLSDEELGTLTSLLEKLNATA